MCEVIDQVKFHIVAPDKIIGMVNIRDANELKTDYCAQCLHCLSFFSTIDRIINFAQKNANYELMDAILMHGYLQDDPVFLRQIGKRCSHKYVKSKMENCDMCHEKKDKYRRSFLRTMMEDDDVLNPIVSKTDLNFYDVNLICDDCYKIAAEINETTSLDA